MDLADRPYFFVRATMSLDINGTVGLAIGEAVSTETDIVVGFSELFL